MRKTIGFFGTAAARASLVLVSQRLSRPFTLRGVRAEFPLGAANLLKLRFYIAPDDHAPTSGSPSGVSLLSENSQVDYIVGDGDIKVLEHEVEVSEAGSYLKVYAVNTDFYDHAVDVQMTIDVEAMKG